MKKFIVLFSLIFLLGGCKKDVPQIRVDILNDTVEVRKTMPISVETESGSILSKRLTNEMNLAEVTRELANVWLKGATKKNVDTSRKLVSFEVIRTEVRTSNECHGYYPVSFSYDVTPKEDVLRSSWIAGNGHIVTRKNSINDKFLIGGIYDENAVWRLEIFGTGGGGSLCSDGTHNTVFKGKQIEWKK